MNWGFIGSFCGLLQGFYQGVRALGLGLKSSFGPAAISSCTVLLAVARHSCTIARRCGHADINRCT